MNRILLALVLTFAAFKAQAATFLVDLAIGDGSLSGTIETADVSGFLETSDIIAFDLTVSTPFGGESSLSSATGAGLFIAGATTLLSENGFLFYNAQDDGGAGIINIASGTTLSSFILQPDFDPFANFGTAIIVSGYDTSLGTAPPEAFEALSFETGLVIGVVPLPAGALLLISGMAVLAPFAYRFRRRLPL